MSKKNVSFNEFNEERETPKNRTIEKEQHLKNVVSHSKTKLKKRFPNGIEPLIKEKEELEEKINKSENRIIEIDNGIINFKKLNWMIKYPKDYIKMLKNERSETGIIESRKLKLSPTTYKNTKQNTPTRRKGGNKNNRHTRRRN